MIRSKTIVAALVASVSLAACGSGGSGGAGASRDQIRAVGSSTVFPFSKAVAEALTKTDLEDHILPQGPIVFDEIGQNKNASIVLLQVQGGQPTVVLPEQFAQAAPNFPAKFG